MSIKCTEVTRSAMVHLHIAEHVDNSTDTQSYISFKRYLQLRKRSLTSMGWRYHL